MTLTSLISCALMVGMASMPVVAAPGSAGTAPSDSVIATSSRPMQYCLTITSGMLGAIQRGDKRLAVVVHAFKPALPASAGLVVSLLTDNKSRKHEAAQFAIYPLRAFSADELGKQQNFLVSLEEHAHLLTEKEPLCIELGFDATRGQLTGGFAEFHIELVDVVAAPKKWPQ